MRAQCREPSVLLGSFPLPLPLNLNLIPNLPSVHWGGLRVRVGLRLGLKSRVRVTKCCALGLNGKGPNKSLTRRRGNLSWANNKFYG